MMDYGCCLCVWMLARLIHIISCHLLLYGILTNPVVLHQILKATTSCAKREKSNNNKQTKGHLYVSLYLVIFQFGFGGVHNDFPVPHGNFKAVYKAFSISMFPGPERSDVEKGGKSEYDIISLYTLDERNY